MTVCIYNIEEVLKIGVAGVYLHLLHYFATHRCLSLTGSFYALCINLLKRNVPKVITWRSWYICSVLNMHISFVTLCNDANNNFMFMFSRQKCNFNIVLVSNGNTIYHSDSIMI